MKRTPLKRGTKQMKRSSFKQKLTVPLKRTRLKMRGSSDTSLLKEQIQAKLRQAVIKRDKRCLLSGYPETGNCGHYARSGDLVLQAEHLISRDFTVTFADLRNVVLLCYRHHIHYKPHNSLRYWEIIEEMIGPDRWDWFQKMRKEQSAHRSYKIDLKLELLALEQQIKKMK